MRKDRKMNRSEELCKLLGIEPNWVNITCKGLECKNKCNLFVLPSDRCRKIEKGEPCQHIYRYKEIYPDLTKPSNFVKLLEIFYKIDELFFITDNFGDETKILQDTVLENTIDLLNGEYTDGLPSYDSQDDKIIKNAKKLAQATKWDY